MCEIGEIIATRELTIEFDDDRAERQLVIEVGKPFQRDPQGDYCCPFRVVGMGSDRVAQAFGVDSLQALQMALVIVRARLDYMVGHHRGAIRWLGEEGSWGLPISAKEAMGRIS